MSLRASYQAVENDRKASLLHFLPLSSELNDLCDLCRPSPPIVKCELDRDKETLDREKMVTARNVHWLALTPPSNSSIKPHNSFIQDLFNQQQVGVLFCSRALHDLTRLKQLDNDKEIFSQERESPKSWLGEKLLQEQGLAQARMVLSQKEELFNAHSNALAPRPRRTPVNLAKLPASQHSLNQHITPEL
ncbi:hypothetical protein EV714DRAFT_278280 [Schizophyllum commune]